MNIKEIFYDWNGLNTELFYKVNGFQPSESFTQFMLLGSRLGKYTLFPVYYLIAILLGYALVQRMKQKEPSAYTAYRQHWADSMIVLLLAFFFSMLWVPGLKDYFHFLRPFVALADGTVNITDAVRASENPMASFPSGHSSFAMMMVAGLWPVLNRALKGLALIYLVWVGWSRMALGVHFPADVTYGFALSFIAVACIRNAWMKNLKKLIFKQT